MVCYVYWLEKGQKPEYDKTNLNIGMLVIIWDLLW